MTRKSNSRRIAGSILMVIGVVLLLAACTWFVRQQAQSQELRAQTEQAPAVSPTSPLAAMTVPAATATATSVPLPTSTISTQAAPIPQPVGVTPTALPILPTPTPAPAVLPVRIVIPDLELDAKVVEMGWEAVNTTAGPQSEWVIPKNAAGHHINSAALNQPGNLVISGHNNIEGKVFEPISLAWDDKTKTRVDDFTDRSEILKGRTIRLYDSAGKSFDYTVSDFFRIKDSGVSLAQRVQNAWFIEPTDDSRLTLVTCWPPWSNTHRLIVVAVPSQP